jgi:hypothetical protein
MRANPCSMWVNLPDDAMFTENKPTAQWGYCLS